MQHNDDQRTTHNARANTIHTTHTHTHNTFTHAHKKAGSPAATPKGSSCVCFLLLLDTRQNAHLLELGDGKPAHRFQDGANHLINLATKVLEEHGDGKAGQHVDKNAEAEKGHDRVDNAVAAQPCG